MLGNTPRTAGGPGGRDRTLAVKSQKIARKSVFFFVKNKNYHFYFFGIYLLLCQNIGGNKFSHTGDSPKWVKSKRWREKERTRERDWTMVITMASYALETPPHVAHAKPPWPKPFIIEYKYPSEDFNEPRKLRYNKECNPHPACSY